MEYVIDNFFNKKDFLVFGKLFIVYNLFLEIMLFRVFFCFLFKVEFNGKL